jgi:hypothetical protein
MGVKDSSNGKGKSKKQAVKDEEDGGRRSGLSDYGMDRMMSLRGKVQ